MTTYSNKKNVLEDVEHFKKSDTFKLYNVSFFIKYSKEKHTIKEAYIYLDYKDNSIYEYQPHLHVLNNDIEITELQYELFNELDKNILRTKIILE